MDGSVTGTQPIAPQGVHRQSFAEQRSSCFNPLTVHFSPFLDFPPSL
jgi:hypothetical protein